MSCPHPPSAHLRNCAWTWCPWCDRSGAAERSQSVLGVLRYLGTAHSWRLAEALHVRRSVVADLLRLLHRSHQVEAVGAVMIRRGDGTRVELTLWRPR